MRAGLEIDEQLVEAAGFHHFGDIDGACHASHIPPLFEPLQRHVANLHLATSIADCFGQLISTSMLVGSTPLTSDTLRMLRS
jgi:hypothetical protein